MLFPRINGEQKSEGRGQEATTLKILHACILEMELNETISVERHLWVHPNQGIGYGHRSKSKICPGPQFQIKELGMVIHLNQGVVHCHLYKSNSWPRSTIQIKDLATATQPNQSF